MLKVSKRDPTMIGGFTVINIMKRIQKQDETVKCKNQISKLFREPQKMKKKMWKSFKRPLMTNIPLKNIINIDLGSKCQTW